ncbi:hypothetical protein FBZ82_112168 [Azospirillum brasilense]|uniref:Uncharacterized protein n=1 Tax=Azospirillum brasilense TaxID=192 RepID=A0A560AU30_AZOBR|nr:hypothetical protein FBZ82_112168 [Azospirillum brasilense]
MAERTAYRERPWRAQPIDAVTPIGLTVTKRVRMVAYRKW